MFNNWSSEDNWLVKSLAGAALGAAAFFLLIGGSVAENIGIVTDTNQPYSAAAVRSNIAKEKAPEHARVHDLPKFTDETTTAIDGAGVFEGELMIEIGDDFDAGTSDHFYYIYDRVTDTVLEMRPKDTLPPGLEAGAMIRAKGNVKDGVIDIDGAAEAGTEGSVEVLEGVTGDAGAALSTRSVLAIIINTTDASPNCSPSTVEGILFNDAGNNMADAFISASHGNVTFAGDVTGPYTVPYLATDSRYTLGNAAQTMAADAGFDVSSYDHVINIIPKDPNNNYAGYGQYNSSQTWVYNCTTRDIYEHEIGHNLNLGHANRNGTVYNDRGSFMGYAGIGLRHINASHMEYKGWLPGSAILNNPGSGQYTLSSSDVDSAGVTNPQALVFAKSDTSQKYYVSYRTPTGYADKMPAEYDYKVQIHTVSPDSRAGTDFVFLSPTTAFVDSVNGISISQVTSGASDSVTLEVAYTGPTCDSKAPTVTISPSEVGSTPGGSAQYSVNVRNNDSSICNTASISLSSGDNSANLSTSLSSSQISLAPGASGNVTLTATSDTGIVGDTHTVTATANNSGQSGSDNALYTIDGTAPTAPTNLSANKKRKQVNLTWNASSDNVGVAGYDVIRNGEVIATTQSTSYADRNFVSGVNSYTVRAYDAAGNGSGLSNTASFDNTSGGGDTGGGGKSKCSPWPSCRNN